MDPAAAQWPDPLGFGRVFYEKLVDGCASIGAAPEAMLGMMTAESGITCAARNASGAQGLTQLMPSTVRNLGYDESKRGPFAAAAPEVQLNFALAYFSQWRRHFGLGGFVNRAQLYQCNFMPATLEGAYDPEEVLIARSKWSIGYDENRWLDANGDFVITLGELEAAIETAVGRTQHRYYDALASLAVVRGYPAVNEVPAADYHLETVDGVQYALSVIPANDGKPYFQRAPTGILGPITRAAVASFQAQHGCTIDGVPGTNTRAALRAEVAKLARAGVPGLASVA